MDKKEKFKDFNKLFIIILNRFPANPTLKDEMTFKYYTLTLLSSIAMFVKRENKAMLAKKFTGALEVEQQMIFIGVNHSQEE